MVCRSSHSPFRAARWGLAGLLLIAVVAADATVLASTGLPQHLAVPSYFYPDLGASNSQWEQLIDGFQTTGGLVVINPSCGPGDSLNSDYAALVDYIRDQNPNVIVLGYVYTDYGDRPTDVDTQANETTPCYQEGMQVVPSVKDDIDTYYAWYQVDGIFFDEVFSSDCTKLSYYQQSYDLVKQDRPGQRVVVINPGRRTQECYMSTADIVVNAENTYSSYVTDDSWEDDAPDWERNYPPTRFWHLIHTASPSRYKMRKAVRLSKERNAGWVFVTYDEMDNPWDDLPIAPYWKAELAAAAAP